MVAQDVDVQPETRAALEALGLLSHKWHPTVLAVLYHRGAVGFNELLDAIPGVSGKVLTDALEALASENLVERTVVSESPLRVEYDLTPAGRDLEAVFTELERWANRHLDAGTPTVLVADGDRRLTEMYGGWLTDRYAVLRGHTGDAIETQLEQGVDVVLASETLPGTDPEELTESMPPDARTVLAVEERTGFDVLRFECDDVIRKPLVRDRVLEAVDVQLSRRGASADRREYFALAAKKSFLDSVYPAETRASNDGYADLCSRLETLADGIEE